MGRIASGWPHQGHLHLIDHHELGDCPGFDHARVEVALGRARWVYGETGTLKLVSMTYRLKWMEFFINEAPWIEMPDK